MPNSVVKTLRDAGIERREVTLLLRHEDKMTKHYCLFCQMRTPLFASQGRAIALIYGNFIDERIMVIPVGIPCHQCGTIYFISGLNQ